MDLFALCNLQGVVTMAAVTACAVTITVSQSAMAGSSKARSATSTADLSINEDSLMSALQVWSISQ